jgi:hypothetical protein
MLHVISKSDLSVFVTNDWEGQGTTSNLWRIGGQQFSVLECLPRKLKKRSSFRDELGELE